MVAGVVGMDRALLSEVSMDSGCELATPELMPWLPHSYELPWLAIPMRLDALAGGVGKVWARSRAGRAPGWEAMVCGGWDR